MQASGDRSGRRASEAQRGGLVGGLAIEVSASPQTAASDSSPGSVAARLSEVLAGRGARLVVLADEGTDSQTVVISALPRSGAARPTGRPERRPRIYKVLHSLLSPLGPSEANRLLVGFLESLPARASSVVLLGDLDGRGPSARNLDQIRLLEAASEWLDARSERDVAVVAVASRDLADGLSGRMSGLSAVPLSIIKRATGGADAALKEPPATAPPGRQVARKGDRSLRDNGSPEDEQQSSPPTRSAVLDRLRAKIVGQPHVVHELAAAWERSLLGLGSDQGPGTVFLFVGPPGVGKTHAARAYAGAIGAGEPLHFRLSEIAAPGAGVSPSADERLPESGREGAITRALRESPPRVVILDEVEHASPALRNVLFRLLDEGVLHAGDGSPILLHGATIFLSTNVSDLGHPRSVALGAQSWLGTPVTLLPRDGVLQRLEPYFESAFLSRIPAALAFEALSRAQLGEIARRRIEVQRQAVLRRTGLSLRVEGAVGEMVVAAGGVTDDARKIEGALRVHLWTRLARILLSYEGQWPRLRSVLLTTEHGGEEPSLSALLLDDRAEEELARLGPLPSWLRLTPCHAREEFLQDLHAFDVVLLDLDWGTGAEDGIRLLRRIRSIAPSVPVLLFTVLEDHDLRTSYFQEGATGFVAKGEPRRLIEVLEAVRREMLATKLAQTPVTGIEWETKAVRDEIQIQLSPVRGRPAF